jgi:dTDP-4-amino-4,6-dideoxygalactose transaminase
VRVPQPGPGFEHAYYRLYAYVRPEGLRSGWTRDRIVAELQHMDVPAFHGSCSEVYREKAFDRTPFRPPQRLPVALELGETSIAFAVHPTLTDEDIDRARSGIHRIFSEAAELPARAKKARQPS